MNEIGSTMAMMVVVSFAFHRIKAFELEISRIQAQLAKCEDEKAWHMSKTQELILSLNAIKVELEAARGQHEEYKVR